LEAVSDSADGGVNEPRQRGTETVLVVEDEQAVRDLTVKMMRQLGYNVLAAAGGDEAIEISRSHTGQISLLLTDVVMPGMSGRQVADALLPARPGLRVLYLSGYTENTVIHHGVLEQGVSFLPKPFSREVLAKKVREVLSNG
jgi:CheY-like chemotaxis protein